MSKHKTYEASDIKVTPAVGPLPFLPHMCKRPAMYLGSPGDDVSTTDYFSALMAYILGYEHAVEVSGGLNRHHVWDLHGGCKRSDSIFGEDFYLFVTGDPEDRTFTIERVIRKQAREKGVKPIDLFAEYYCSYFTMTPLERLAHAGKS